MPQFWNDILVVTKEEIVPSFLTWSALESLIHRYKNKPYGIKRVQRACNGKPMLISFDSLPVEIQQAIGDPRKCDHILEKFYEIDGEAVEFFAKFRFQDETALDTKAQEKFIINASMLRAIKKLKFARELERRSKSGSLTGIMATLCADAASFNKTLKIKHGVEHTLPDSEKRFKEALKSFETHGYAGLKGLARYKNDNSLKVTDHALELLKNLFAGDSHKPIAIEIYRRYNAFITGQITVINNNSGEVYDPSMYMSLSAATVTNYLLQKWENKIGTFATRSGNRQDYMEQFKPTQSMRRPELPGSLLSVDDRQPAFKCIELKGERIWFYNAVDIASGAYTCWVHGKSKEGLILDFYRQLIRNYAEWGFNLPLGLECESSLNSSHKDTFLRPGAMFKHVRIEANNARGKRIEREFRDLRYKYEKNRVGFQARPFAKSEANLPGSDKAPMLPYDTIVEGCLADIESINNEPHPIHKHLSKWKVFCQMQNPDTQPTNYTTILPHLGYKTETSCRVGQIALNRGKYLLGNDGHIATGEELIRLMCEVEGRNVDIYWLDGNDGQILKALVYIGSQYICEAVLKPDYQRAAAEQTPQDIQNMALMNSYVSTIEAFGRRAKASIEPVTIINNTLPREKDFVMPGLRTRRPLTSWQETEVIAEMEEERVLVKVGKTSKTLEDRF